jgi:MoxR-like ATPase
VIDVESVQALAERAARNVERVLVGKRDVIDLVLVALLCEGHVLLEDVPGVGKTVLARSVARTLDCTYRRIQCTPDVLPSDVTGVAFFNQRTQDFEFRPGPIFAQVVLADEINRATPRTQAALLECMEERQVSTEGETHLLPRPFLVLATQNPIELEGTFPLPEAQLDRFLLRLSVGYPGEADEQQVIRRFRGGSPLDELPAVVTAAELLAIQRQVREVHVAPAIDEYVVRLVRATRLHASIQLGASPRASLGLARAAQAYAGLRGRSYVLPDDVKRLAPAVLIHRLIPSAQARLRGTGAAEVVRDVLDAVPAPVEDPRPTAA